MLRNYWCGKSTLWSHRRERHTEKPQRTLSLISLMCSGKHVEIGQGMRWKFQCAAQFKDINFSGGAKRHKHQALVVCWWVCWNFFSQLMLLEWRSVYDVVSYFHIAWGGLGRMEFLVNSLRLWWWLNVGREKRKLPWQRDSETRSENIFRFFVYFNDVLRDGKCLVFLYFSPYCEWCAARQQSGPHRPKVCWGKHETPQPWWCGAFLRTDLSKARVDFLFNLFFSSWRFDVIKRLSPSTTMKWERFSWWQIEEKWNHYVLKAATLDHQALRREMKDESLAEKFVIKTSHNSAVPFVARGRDVGFILNDIFRYKKPWDCL